MGKAGTPAAARGRTDFISTSVAESWDAGIVVGSGRVGAVLWGRPGEIRLSLSHEHFFLPVNERPAPPELAEARRAARRALLDGDPEGAAGIIDDAAGTRELVWTDPLAPCATLTLTLPGTEREPVGYRRGVDFAAGLARIGWSSAAVDAATEATAPRGGERVVLEVTAPPGLPFEARLEARGAPAGVRLEPSRGADHVALGVFAPGVVNGTARGATTRLSCAEDVGLHTEAAGSGARAHGVVPPGGRFTLLLDLTVTGAPESAAGPKAPREPPRPEDSRGSDGPSGQDEHRRLHGASWLELSSGVDPAVPVEELFARAATDERSRRALVELAYAAGRYNVICSTGDLPPTLQGVWQGTWHPAWSSDFTMNGNLQNGAAASLVPTGTPELIRSVTRLMTAHLEDYRVNARRLFGFEGAMVPSRMSTHGLANHFSHEYPHQFWTGAGGWILRMLADAVLSTGDASLVDDATWECAVDVMRFYGQLAAEGPIAPGYSPENTPARRSTPLAVDPAMDVAILRDAPLAFRVLAEARGEQVPPGAGYAPPPASYRVSPTGELAEWGDPRYEDRLEHRHSSQLYPLWYLQDEALDESLRAAAGMLVREKIAWRAADPGPPPGHMEMAFGLVQLGMAAAALGDAESALRCADWLAVSHFTPALTSTHDAGEIFNVDASGGLPALVAAMLVQSTRSRIVLLPALPEAWRSGAVGGLTTRTGFVVAELRWDAEGADAVLCPAPESAWVRRGGIRLSLPGAARMRSGSGWTRPSRAFELDPSGRLELALRWEC